MSTRQRPQHAAAGNAAYPAESALPRLCRANATESDDDLLQMFQRSGCLLIETGALSAAQAREYFLSLERIFGRILPDDATIEGWYAVCPKGEASDPRFLADSSGQFALHTDQAFSPSPPDIMGLLCESAAPRGGESLIADAGALYRYVYREGGESALTSLFQPFYRLRRPPHVLRRPLFFPVRTERTGIAYRSDDAGAQATYPDAYAPVMECVKAFLADPGNCLRQPLLPGQILLLDNLRYLHGRNSFSGHRLLWRLHFRARPEVSQHLGFIGDAPVARPALGD